MCLQSIWFFLWGLLWSLFFITDGFDFGVGTLYPFLGKNDNDKRIMINSIGPLWDGNEVWLITAGGVTFAAFPLVYAVMFSSFYTPLMLILFALIIRGVSFEFRGKVDHNAWRKIFDTCIFVGSIVPAILFGVFFANIFTGIPIDNAGIFHGNIFTFLKPYALLGGAFFLLLFLQHGSIWLCIKTEGELQNRAIKTANYIWPILVIIAIAFLVATKFETTLYENYINHLILFIVPLIAVVALIVLKIYMVKKAYFKAWFSSAIVIISCVFFGIIGLFPKLLPSTLNSKFTLTAFNASSSSLTLKIMLVVVIIFIPIVLCYQIWSYHLFKYKVTLNDIMKNSESY